MSHMVKMSMPEISDLDVLEKACKRLGLKLDKNKKRAAYYAGKKLDCDAVISSDKTTYEIAVRKVKKDGKASYEIQADLFDGRLRDIVGNNCGKLSQAYQVEAHRKIARNRGYEIIGERANAETGNIELRIKV